MTCKTINRLVDSREYWTMVCKSFGVDIDISRSEKSYFKTKFLQSGERRCGGCFRKIGSFNKIYNIYLCNCCSKSDEYNRITKHYAKRKYKLPEEAFIIYNEEEQRKNNEAEDRRVKDILHEEKRFRECGYRKEIEPDNHVDNALKYKHRHGATFATNCDNCLLKRSQVERVAAFYQTSRYRQIIASKEDDKREALRRERKGKKPKRDSDPESDIDPDSPRYYRGSSLEPDSDEYDSPLD